MKPMTTAFAIEFKPLADPDAVVAGQNYRFTLLTEQLLRLEYSPEGVFEDRASQTFWTRRLPVPAYTVRREGENLEIETHYLLLQYAEDQPFSTGSLRITLKESGAVWHYGDDDPLNLGGTARTLDQVDGARDLEEGLLSRSGWAVYDDTPRLVFNSDGWLEERPSIPGYRDLMFFGYGADYQACLHDFTRVAGPAPQIPRWALGNWWSRYWAYSAAELLGVVDEFRSHQVPLSVCIVDMDWHIVDTGNACSGWTGYTWNRNLFPDPTAFINALHERGLKTALNLHPAEGVHAHEAQYEAMCARLGIDPQSQVPIPFDIADPAFTAAYFDLLHYPQEENGVDFWWMDWQQGTLSSLPGLDPLTWLNHLHFYDLGRGGDRRPFIFSRWGGLGNHRTPIGFSGDTVITWDSLAFQPYFTATAANVNYGWWSHDIGGHFGGYEEPQLYTRWVQFGVFSPILRLHSTNNPFHERRPWGWDAETERVSSAALRLRHQLIPYLYSMAWRNHVEDQPLVRPMYHEYPSDEQAYHCPDQYFFGSELLVAPFLEALDADTRLSRQVVWLPPGEWFGFFDGLVYHGDGWHALYGGMDDIPVFARAGAVVPMGPRAAWGGITNPEALEVHFFPGADGEFALYEDDGLQSSSLTPLAQTWGEQTWQVAIGPEEGEMGHLPTARAYQLIFRGLGAEVKPDVRKNNAPTEATSTYDVALGALRVTINGVQPGDRVTVSVPAHAFQRHDGRLERCRKLVHAARMESYTKLALDNELEKIVAQPERLEKYQLRLTASQMRALGEMITGAGLHRRSRRDQAGEAIILWNNQGTSAVHFHLAALDINKKEQTLKGALPKFAVLLHDNEGMTWHQGSQLAQGRVSVESWLEALPGRMAAGEQNLALGLKVLGDNGRSATIWIENGQVLMHDGLAEGLDAVISAAHEDWLALINGETTPEALFVQGKIKIEGSVELLLHMASLFDIVAPGNYLAEGWRLMINYWDFLYLDMA